MRRLLLALALLAGCAADIRYPPAVQVPTTAEATSALRDALSLAAVRAINRASRLDGYYANPRLRIDIAPDAQSLAKRLRDAGFGDQYERTVEQINRIAEQSSRNARRTFIKAITAMEIEDPFEYLAALEDDAGTNALMDQAYDDIYAEYLLLVKTSCGRAVSAHHTMGSLSPITLWRRVSMSISSSSVTSRNDRSMACLS